MADDQPDTQALDDEVTTTKWRATQRIQEWLHTEGTPYSSCGAWADTCPDWDLAYTLAEVALELPRKERHLPEPNGPCYSCANNVKRPKDFTVPMPQWEQTLRAYVFAAVIGMVVGIVVIAVVKGL